MDNRKQAEADFHNIRERDRLALEQQAFERKYPNKTFYSITRKSQQSLREWMQQNCPGRIALDYCCGLGKTTLELARHGALAYGIDIAEEEIKEAARNAAVAGYSERTRFMIMDAEDLQFEDGFFDVIVCNGVLHHLDLDRAYSGLARVLKPDGQIICVEALGHNPVINSYRRLTPHLRTAWEIDHILKLGDVERAKTYFGKVSVRFFYLFSILAIPFRKTPIFNSALGLLETVDAFVLKIPLVQLLAWQIMFVLSEPKRK